MKIFVDAHCFDTEFQGTQTFVRELYTELLQFTAMEVFFGCHKPENLQRAFPKLPPTNILQYPGSAISRFFTAIPAILKKGRYDYAHFQNISPLPVTGCNYIVTLHDTLFTQSTKYFPPVYRLSRKYAFGRSLQSAFLKTTVSEYSKCEISKMYNISPSDLYVIPNGVREDFGQGLSSKMASKIIMEKYGIQNFILCVSRIEPRKNQLLLLEMYLHLKLYEEKISLVLIGAESIKVAGLNLLIRKMPDKARNYFFHLKQVSQDDLVAFYRACKLFVYPSMAEGFGIPPLEAACCNAPVLCSSLSAMRSFDFFEPNTFDPEDHDQFIAKLQQMLTDRGPEENRTLIAQKIFQEYSWKKSAALFHNLLISNIA